MNIALIVAGGNGKRMGLEIPKQFVKVNDKPVIFYSLKAFSNVKEIDEIFVVCHKDYISDLYNIIKDYSIEKIQDVIEGGKTRQESVFNGLKAIKAAGCKDEDIILIHDAARPMVSQEIIKDNIKSCLTYGACETAVKVADTIIKSEKGDNLNEVMNRDVLYQVQTPQTFSLGLILESHKKAPCNCATDDAQMVKALGHEVAIVNGSKLNFKITTIEDLELFKSLAN